MPATCKKLGQNLLLFEEQNQKDSVEIKLKNKSSQELDFQLDFSESQGVLIENSITANVETIEDLKSKGSQVISQTIPPNSTHKFAGIYLISESSCLKYSSNFQDSPGIPSGADSKKSETPTEIGTPSSADGPLGTEVPVPTPSYELRFFEKRVESSYTSISRFEGSQSLDLFFPPDYNSLFLGAENSEMEDPVRWQRPDEFMKGSYELYLDRIEPADINQGALGDCWFMSPIAVLAEKPELVKRLFVNKGVSEIGLYHVWFCKDGEWVRVTVDDYFPCLMGARTAFSKPNGNELWVMLLEKAYSKLHGSYKIIEGGLPHKGLRDLTGLPSKAHFFESDGTQSMIRDGSFWDLLKNYSDKGYLMTASVDKSTEEAKYKGLVTGHGYSLLRCAEAYGNKLLNIRNPWGHYEWEGAWCDHSRCWTSKMKEALNPNLDEDDGAFWISYEDFLKYFSTMSVAICEDFSEKRLKGVFKRNSSGASTEFYYEVEVKADTKVYVELFQEDTRIYGVNEWRKPTDMSINIFEKVGNGLCKLKTSMHACISELMEEVTLEAGKTYVIFPFSRGNEIEEPLYGGGGLHDDVLNPRLLFTLKDIFKRASKSMSEGLTQEEFQNLMSETQDQYDQSLAKQLMLGTEKMLFEEFAQFFKSSIQTQNVMNWLEKWGYGEFPWASTYRTYVLVLHGLSELQVKQFTPSEVFIEKFHEATQGMHRV